MKPVIANISKKLQRRYSLPVHAQSVRFLDQYTMVVVEVAEMWNWLQFNAAVQATLLDG
eukprot:CAMPEP_0171710050 /NCGR_PEP_ID=MMETSP0991-20121206/15798_1 /TAXON_ID=483369 /ORGANISM="non described non described, Strain CCMP2098" /LENGTH=58 /DNA_ID=CAMNT_0012300185 /DNA_START=387 /DNA_END=563 /DNA_ORIENTATION=+